MFLVNRCIQGIHIFVIIIIIIKYFFFYNVLNVLFVAHLLHYLKVQ